MKISAYIADLTAAGMTDDAARTFAKDKATQLPLVDDIGLTMPLASALVKGDVSLGLSEEDATERARVAIAKGKAVDDLAAASVEPVTVTDALTQLEAASAELLKGKAECKDDDDDDDDGGDDGSDDGKPDGLDGDDRGKPDTMPARKGMSAGEMAELLKGALIEINAQTQAETKAVRDELKALRSTLDGIAKGIGTQGASLAAALRGFETTGQALSQLAKGIGEPRTPRGDGNVAGVGYQPHPSETVAASMQSVDRVGIRMRALAKGASDPSLAAECAKLQTMIIDGADNATVQAAATKLGLA